MQNRPAPPRKKPHPPRKKRNISLFFYLLFWVLILAMFSGLIIGQAGTYNDLQDQLNSLQADVARERARQDELQMQIFFFDSDAYIMQLARERGMVFPHEIVFRNIAE